MKLLGNIYLIFYITLLNFCYAKVEDYLKGIEFERSFSPIEGKVIDINVSVKEKDLKEILEKAQFSLKDFTAVYHGNIPEELKPSVKVSLNITVDDQIYSYEKVKFKVGGNSSRILSKLGYNLNLNKEDRFFGRKNLRLRADYIDATTIRTKLVVDLINKWNIPTVQETYANFYVNNQYYGFYLFSDDIKPGWVTDIYDRPEDEEVKTLYSCSKSTFKFDPETIKTVCKNEKDDYLNYTEPLYHLVDEIYNYTSLKELERKFDDVDNIRKIFAFEYLFGAIDNFLVGGGNYNLYQKSNGKWNYIPMDFNYVFLINIKRLLLTSPNRLPHLDHVIDYTKLKFEEWHGAGVRKPFIEILYYKDKKKFGKIIKELLITGFNPDELFPRIDELLHYIKPYIKQDTTPDENGQLPGRVNLKGEDVPHSYEESKRNANFEEDQDGNIGLKKYIQAKFDAVIKLFDLNKKEILSHAKVYRKKRAYEIKIYDLNQKIEKLKEQMEKEGLKHHKHVKSKKYRQKIEYESKVHDLNKKVQKLNKDLEKAFKK